MSRSLQISMIGIDSNQLSAMNFTQYIQKKTSTNILQHLHHEFISSIRLGDLELYIYGLLRIANYFFTFNHPSYARQLVRYHGNFLKLSETHKDVYDEFKKGCFGIKRTKKDFSRRPIDITFEQTVNADAASRKTRISFFYEFNICKTVIG